MSVTGTDVPISVIAVAFAHRYATFRLVERRSRKQATAQCARHGAQPSARSPGAAPRSPASITVCWCDWRARVPTQLRASTRDLAHLSAQRRASEHPSSAMAATVSVLLNAILLATAPTDYPVRIGRSAKTLHTLATQRLADNNNLHKACAALHGNVEDSVVAAFKKFESDDIQVLGFFLSKNTKCKRLTCVAHGRALRRGSALETHHFTARRHSVPRVLTRCIRDAILAISLSRNNIEGRGAAALGEALSLNTALETLECVSRFWRARPCTARVHVTKHNVRAHARL